MYQVLLPNHRPSDEKSAYIFASALQTIEVSLFKCPYRKKCLIRLTSYIKTLLNDMAIKRTP